MKRFQCTSNEYGLDFIEVVGHSRQIHAANSSLAFAALRLCVNTGVWYLKRWFSRKDAKTQRNTN
jgi:hypothetical protein